MPKSNAPGSARTDKLQLIPARVKNAVAGVDWITATARGERDRMRFGLIAHALMAQETAAGNDVSGRCHPNYKGWSVGGIAYGERPEDCYIRMSGALASTNWRRLMPHASTVSRYDLAVTYELESPYLGAESRIYQLASEAWTGRGRPPTAQVVKDSRGGATVNLGARSSSRYCRVYDKGAESGAAPLGTLWRVEVELKKAVAKRAASQVEADDDEAASVIAHVAGELGRRGWKLPRYAGTSRLTRACDRAPTDDERRLDWLATQVRPTVETLIKHGKGAEVWAALGLSDMTP